MAAPTATLGGTAVDALTVVSATQFTFKIPAGTDTGTALDLVFTNDAGTATKAGAVTVNPPKPAISSVTPTAGVAGEEITATGTNFQ